MGQTAAKLERKVDRNRGQIEDLATRADNQEALLAERVEGVVGSELQGIMSRVEALELGAPQGGSGGKKAGEGRHMTGLGSP